MGIGHDHSRTRGAATARSAIPLSVRRPRHLQRNATGESVERFRQSECTASVPCFHGPNGTACATDESAGDVSATTTLELRRAETHRHQKIYATRQPTQRQVAKPTREPNVLQTGHDRFLPPTWPSNGAAMLPSPRLTIRPPRGGKECSLKPTVIRHTPAALPHLDAVRTRPRPPRRMDRRMDPVPVPETSC